MPNFKRSADEPPRVQFANGQVKTYCPRCERQVALDDADGRALTGLEEALVVKENLLLERKVALTCPHCDTHWLGDVPPSAGNFRVVLAEIGVTKREVRRRLGPPVSTLTSRAFYKGTVVLSGAVPRREAYWLYENDATGLQTMITFRRGRVAAVEQRRG